MSHLTASAKLPTTIPPRISLSASQHQCTSTPDFATYATPDSSVSPVLAPKNAHAHRDTSSEHEMDDLDMEGIDDIATRAAHASSPALESHELRAEEVPELAPLMLAETYLPAIFAQHGPCAIRHLTQHLSVNNPKFGALPAGKQRRLIVKALELKKNALFEKVGWGRWNQVEGRALYTPETLPQRYGSLGTGSRQSAHTTDAHRYPAMGSYPVSSFSSHHEFMFSPSLSVAEAGRDGGEDDGDIDPLDLSLEADDSETDEEDWQSLGAEALRARKPTSVSGSLRESGVHLGSSYQRSMPYPIRRQSSAVSLSTSSPQLLPGSFANGSSLSRPSFPKSSSYLKASPMSHARTSSFEPPDKSPARSRVPSSLTLNASKGTDAEAVEALVMLSGSHDAEAKGDCK